MARRGAEDREAAQRVLVYAPSPLGGLAEHVHYQATELARRGFDVSVLCRPDFAKPAAATAYRQDRALFVRHGSGRVARALRAAGEVLNRHILAWRILTWRPRFVLLEANSEFHAVGWFAPHWLLHRAGTVYVTNFHDPVRGPANGWRRAWHGLNLRLAYASLDGGLIHSPPPPGAYLPQRMIVREAPFGPFTEAARHPPRGDLRARLGIARDAYVLLAFGHLADRKNLDLVIAALAGLPDVVLIVAGVPVSASDRGADWYRAWAGTCGVAGQVRFAPGFVSEADVSAYFAAADAVALTYSRGFVSHSGVLHMAALWDRPVLASGGEGPMRQAVDAFGLGVTVAPDSSEAIAAGLRRLITEPTDRAAGFTRFRATMSWQSNVDRLLEVVERIAADRRLPRPGPAATPMAR